MYRDRFSTGPVGVAILNVQDDELLPSVKLGVVTVAAMYSHVAEEAHQRNVLFLEAFLEHLPEDPSTITPMIANSFARVLIESGRGVGPDGEQKEFFGSKFAGVLMRCNTNLQGVERLNWIAEYKAKRSEFLPLQPRAGLVKRLRTAYESYCVPDLLKKAETAIITLEHVEGVVQEKDDSLAGIDRERVPIAEANWALEEEVEALQKVTKEDSTYMQYCPPGEDFHTLQPDLAREQVLEFWERRHELFGAQLKDLQNGEENKTQSWTEDQVFSVLRKHTGFDSLFGPGVRRELHAAPPATEPMQDTQPEMPLTQEVSTLVATVVANVLARAGDE